MQLCLFLQTDLKLKTFCAETTLKELQLALLETLSYPDKKQSGSNGLEHVSMDNRLPGVIHINCNLGACEMAYMCALSFQACGHQALGIYIRQIPHARVATITCIWGYTCRTLLLLKNSWCLIKSPKLTVYCYAYYIAMGSSCDYGIIILTFSWCLFIQCIEVILIVSLELNMCNTYKQKLPLRNRDKW